MTAAPENWVINGKLHWPTKDVNSKRKKQVPPENEWLVYDCKILGESFGKKGHIVSGSSDFAHSTFGYDIEDYTYRRIYVIPHMETFNN